MKKIIVVIAFISSLALALPVSIVQQFVIRTDWIELEKRSAYCQGVLEGLTALYPAAKYGVSTYSYSNDDNLAITKLEAEAAMARNRLEWGTPWRQNGDSIQRGFATPTEKNTAFFVSLKPAADDRSAQICVSFVTTLL